MGSFIAQGNSLILFISTSIGSMKNLLTLIWERVVCVGKRFAETINKTRKQAVFPGAVLAGNMANKTLTEQIGSVTGLVILNIFLAALLLKIVRDAVTGTKILSQHEKVKSFFQVWKNNKNLLLVKVEQGLKAISTLTLRKKKHNFKLASPKKRQSLVSARQAQKELLFIDNRFPAIAVVAVLLTAMFAYNWPERYQLANLIPSQTLQRSVSNPTNSTQVAGDTDANNSTDASQCVSTDCQTILEKHPNLYALLAPTETSTQNLKLGGMLLTRHGELFIASGTVVSDSIQRHGVRSINLGTNSVTSRVIKNGTISSEDLASTLKIGRLKLGRALATDEGGTGLSSYTPGDLLYYSSGSALSRLALGAVNQILKSNEAGLFWSDEISYTASGNLLQLANQNFSLKEGTLDDGKICTYSVTTGLECTTTAGSVGVNYWTMSSNNLYPNNLTDNLALGATNAGSAKLYVNGNVGIGTTSPIQALDVNGVVFSHNYFQAPSGLYDSANGSYFIDPYVASGNSIIVSGNVGIGTTGPLAPLDIFRATALGNGSIINVSANGADYGGLRSIDANTLGIRGATGVALDLGAGATNGYVRITTTGNVGIGTTAPGAKLEVNGGAYFSGNVGIGITNPLYALHVSGTAIVNGILGTNTGGSASNPSLFVNSQATGFFSAGGSYGLGFSVNGTQRMVLDTSGNVGIGTTSPGANLQVGDGTGLRTVKIYSGSALSNASPVLSLFSAGVREGVISFSGDKMIFGNTSGLADYNSATLLAAANLVIQANGNVGIGTVAPEKYLDVSGPSTTTGFDTQIVARISHNGSNDVAGLGFAVSSSASQISSYIGLIRNGAGAYGDMIFGNKTGGGIAGLVDEKMRITNAGNVGIGTTAPGAKLDVSANLATWNSDGIYAKLSSGNSDARYLEFGQKNVIGNAFSYIQARTNMSSPLDNYTLLLNPAGGNVGIGTTSPGARLAVVGANDVAIQSIFEATGGVEVGKLGGIQIGNGVSNQNAQLVFNSGGNNTFDIRTNYNNTANKITLSPGTATAMTLLGSGNVGIGTTGPRVKLDVMGNMMIGANGSGDGLTADNGGNINIYSLTRQDAVSTGDLSISAFGGIGLTTNRRTNNPAASGYNLYVATTGNVGIGTTNPGSQLTVRTTASSSNLGIIGIETGNTASSQGINFLKSAGAFNGPMASIMARATDYGNTSASALDFATNIAIETTPSVKMTITNLGNVGIGTTSPGGKVDITGNGIGLKLTDSGGNSYIESSDTWGQKWKFAGESANAEMNVVNTAWQFNINQTIGGLTRFRFNNNKTQYGDAVGPIMDLNINKSVIFYGNVGIGTTNPLAKLVTIGDVGQYSAGFTSAGSPIGSSLYLGDYNFYSPTYYNQAPGLSAVFGGLAVADSLAFYTYTGGVRTEQMRIKYNGNVGIGTTNPASKFQVFASPAANTTFGTLSLGGGVFGGGTGTFVGSTNGTSFAVNEASGFTGSLMDLQLNGVSQARVGYDGNLRVTALSASGNQLYLQGGTSGRVALYNGGGDNTFEVFGSASNTVPNVHLAGTPNAVSYITSGNVGIGTTSPLGKLNVGDSLYINYGNANILGQSSYVDTNTIRGVTAINPAAGITGIYVKDDGNVGIGTTENNYKLDISSSSGQNSMRIQTYPAAGNDLIIGNGPSSTGATIYTNNHNSGNRLPLYIDGSVLLLNSSGGGNVGIGTTAPMEILDVNGRLHLARVSAPGTITDKLYNVSGNLFWNGINLSAGGSLPTGTEGQMLYNNAGSWSAMSGMFWDDANSRLGIGTTAPTAKLAIQGTSDYATLGLEKVTDGDFASAGPWIYGAGWTYDAINHEVDHVPGVNIDSLEQDVGSVGGEYYRVTFTVKNRTQGYNMWFGFGNHTSSWTAVDHNGSYEEVIQARETGNLKFSPANDFDGSLDDISVVKVTPAETVLALLNSDGTTGLEMRSGGPYAENTFIGIESGLSNQTGGDNTAIGHQALMNNTTGDYNTAVGVWALLLNTTGQENSAVGDEALVSNTTGSFNNGMGEYALYENTTGDYNIAIGDSAGENSANGSNNVFLGAYSGNGNNINYFNANNNVAVGYEAGFSVTNNSSNNLFLGYQAGYHEIGSNKLYIANAQDSALIYGDFSTGMLGIGGTAAQTNPYLYIKAGGNVGIGTTNPGYALDVNGSLKAAGMIFSNPSADRNILMTANSGDLMIGGGSDTSGGGSFMRFFGKDYGGTDVGGGISFRMNNGTGANGNTTFGTTGGTNYVTILGSNGNVGIGTTAPGYKLQLIGSVDSYLSSFYNSGVTASAGGLYIRSDGLGNLLTLDYAGTDVLTVSGAQTTFGNPVNFASAGDVSFANDLISTNGTAGNIFFQGPGYISTQSAWQNLDLTLSAANTGEVIIDDDIQITGSRLNVNANGNVGIGTTSPSYPFVINPPGNVGATIALTSTGGAGSSIIFGNSNTFTQQISTNASLANDFEIYNGGLRGATYPMLTLTSTGQLGIGNQVNPALILAGLDVFTPVTSVSGVGYGARLKETITASANNDNLYGLYVNPTFTNGAFTGVGNYSAVFMGGNVGIGTTSPGELLTLAGNHKIMFTGVSAQNQPSYIYTDSSDNLLLTASGAQGKSLNLGTGGWSAVRLDASYLTLTGGNYGTTINGNVGIGTTNPGVQLQIGDMATSGTRYAYIVDANLGLKLSNTGIIQLVGAAGNLEFKANNTNSGNYIFSSTGNVGIGTTNPGLALDVVGNARFSAIGSGAYTGAVNRMADGTLTTATSDARLKKNITTIDNPLDKVMALRGVTFNWTDPNNPKRMLGMIAQEVLPIVPELVFQSSDGYYGINYGETSGLLIEAIKQQQGEITGITNNQNQIVAKLTGQLADQNLSVDSKLKLIGETLSTINANTQILETQPQLVSDLQAQVAKQARDLVTLQAQMADIQAQNKAFNDFLLAFDVGSIDNFAQKNAPLNVFTGQLEANSLVAGAFSVKVVDATRKTLGSAIICEAGKIWKDNVCIDPVEGETLSDGKTIKVDTKAVSATAKIFITPEGDTGGRMWVEKQTDVATGAYTGFEIKCSDPIVGSLKVNWWIVEEK